LAETAKAEGTEPISIAKLAVETKSAFLARPKTP